MEANEGKKGEISLRPGQYTKIYLKLESSFSKDFPVASHK